jgi:hypothetical protein
MRARPNLTADQVVQDYLHKVAAASQTLPKGDRIAFVSRTKARVERQVSAAGAADPGEVRQVLAALGTPEELVRQERLRIDSKWLKSRARKGDTATVTAAPASASRGGHRRLNTRWRPVAEPLQQDPGPGPASLPDAAAAGETETPAASRTDAAAAGRTGTTATGEANRTAPPPWPGDLEAMMHPEPAAGEDPASQRPPTPLDELWQLARGHRLESVAVVLMGLGGALLPFPFWPAGALVAMFSRLWDGKDKTVALAGPGLVDLLGSVVSAFLMGGSQNVVVIYTHALEVDSGLWIRVGCVLTAVYLGWRVSQGRRVKVPPWRR